MPCDLSIYFMHLCLITLFYTVVYAIKIQICKFVRTWWLQMQELAERARQANKVGSVRLCQARRQVVITWGAPGLFKGAPYNLSSCSPIHFFFSLLFLSCPSTASQTTQTKLTKLSWQQNYLFTLSTHNSYYSICNWTKLDICVRHLFW